MIRPTTTVNLKCRIQLSVDQPSTTNSTLRVCRHNFLCKACMDGQHFQQSRVWINPVWFPRSAEQETCFCPLPVRACEFGLAKRVRPPRPAPARSLSTLRQYLALTRGIPPTFRDGVHLSRQPPSGQSQVDQVTQLHAEGVNCRESSGDFNIV